MEYSDAYSKTSGHLCHYYRDEIFLNNDINVIDFPEYNNNSNSFKFKQQITGQIGNGCIKDV